MPRNTDSYATLLEVALSRPLPPCFALAHRNTCLLQQRSGYLKTILALKGQFTEETKESPKLGTRKISFQDEEVKVFIYNTKGITTAVSFDKNVPLCVQPRLLPSAKFIAKCVWMCLVGAVPWQRTVWGQHHNLVHNVALYYPHLTIDIIRSDLRKIYASFRHFRPAVIDYKHSLKLPYQYRKKTFDHIKGRWMMGREMIQVATRLRLYLIKVIKDSELAAISIQAAWRRKNAYKTIQQKRH